MKAMLEIIGHLTVKPMMPMALAIMSAEANGVTLKSFYCTDTKASMKRFCGILIDYDNYHQPTALRMSIYSFQLIYNRFAWKRSSRTKAVEQL